MEEKLRSKSAIQREFRDKILFSAKDEREIMIKQLSEKIYCFLQAETAINPVKYDEVISDVIEDSVAYIQDWNPAKASDAFLSLMKYVLNMLDQPYKKTYWTLRTYSGYYFLKVRQYLRQPERVLFLIGYEMKDDFTLQLSYSKLVDVETRIRIACDCLMASSECCVISTIWDSIRSLGYTLKDIVHCRKVFCTSTDKTVSWIKQNLPATKPPQKVIDEYGNKQNKQSKKNVDTTKNTNSPSEENQARINENEKISAAEIISRIESRTEKHTANFSRPVVSAESRVSYKQSKPAPPGHLLEGTNEDHMEASFIATEKLSVRGPDILQVTQADNFTHSLWSTKEDSDRILNNARPHDGYFHDTDDRPYLRTIPNMAKSYITSTVPQTTATAKSVNLSKSSNVYPVGTVYSMKKPKDVQTVTNCKAGSSPNTDSSLPVNSTYKYSKQNLSGRSDLYGSHIATASSTSRPRVSSDLYGSHIATSSSTSRPRVSSAPGGPASLGNMAGLQLSGDTNSMVQDKGGKSGTERTRSKNKNESLHDQPDKVSLTGIKTTWICKRCTYENKNVGNQTECEICGEAFDTMV